jgi:hypothetical protein
VETTSTERAFTLATDYMASLIEWGELPNADPGHPGVPCASWLVGGIADVFEVLIIKPADLSTDEFRDVISRMSHSRPWTQAQQDLADEVHRKFAPDGD